LALLTRRYDDDDDDSAGARSNRPKCATGALRGSGVVIEDVEVVVESSPIAALHGGVLVVLDVFLDVSSVGRRSAPRDDMVMSTSVLVVNIRGIIIIEQSSVLQLFVRVGLD
jgi:hypothetical protein